MNEVTCIGCGGTLQNTDNKAPFYTPKELTETEQLYCQRCFRMRNYGEIIPTALEAHDYQHILSSLQDKNARIAMVIDLFDIEGSMIPQINRIITSDDQLMIIGNKRDLLPKTVGEGKIKHRLLKILKNAELKANHIELVSATKNLNIDALIDALFAHGKGKDIYIVGATNVGKSTLINQMLKASTGEKGDLITMSPSKGTTQNFIPIAFGNQTLYDTPGLYNKNHISNVISAETLKKITPTKELKQRVYQLNPDQTLLMNDLARLEFVQGDKSNFMAFFPDNVYVHRTKTSSVERYLKNINPDHILAEKPLTYTSTQFSFKPFQKEDIVIPGLGFITLKGKGIVRIVTPKGIQPYKREALF